MQPKRYEGDLQLYPSLTSLSLTLTISDIAENKGMNERGPSPIVWLGFVKRKGMGEGMDL